MTLDELYKNKGLLITQKEICDAKLENINKEIVRLLSSNGKEAIPEPDKKDTAEVKK